MAKTELCRGIPTGEKRREGRRWVHPKSHCHGCTSAKERIAELQQEKFRLNLAREKDIEVHGSIRSELRRDLTAMRTRVGELALELDISLRYAHHAEHSTTTEFESCTRESCVNGRAALARAKELEVGDA